MALLLHLFKSIFFSNVNLLYLGIAFAKPFRKILISLLPIAFFGSPVLGQATFIIGSETTSKTSYTPPAGTDRIIVVQVGDEDGNSIGDVTAITWGAGLQALTFVSERIHDDDIRTEVWYLDEAGIASEVSGTGDFVVTGTGTWANKEKFSAFTIEGVDQTSVVRSSTEGSIAGTNPITLGSMNVFTNDIYYFSAANRNETSHTPPPTFTEINDETNPNPGWTMADAFKEITADGSEAPSADFAAPTVTVWCCLYTCRRRPTTH